MNLVMLKSFAMLFTNSVSSSLAATIIPSVRRDFSKASIVRASAGKEHISSFALDTFPIRVPIPAASISAAVFGIFHAPPQLYPNHNNCIISVKKNQDVFVI
jgi:hypothetical protein